MAAKPKRPVGWGELNVALNSLVREGVIVGYSTAAVESGTSVEVATASGADQADVVRRVREALPTAFAEAQAGLRKGWQPSISSSLLLVSPRPVWQHGPGVCPA